MTGVLMEKGNLDTGMYTGTLPFEDGGIPWGDHKPSNAKDC